MRRLVYFAGPDLFFDNYASIKRLIESLCDPRRLYPMFPTEPDIPDPAIIFRENLNMVRESHVVIANLAPFRSVVEPDSGTAFECGVACAHGIPVVAICPDLRPMKEKFDPATIHHDDAGRMRCPTGALIEDFDCPVNLMLAYSAAAVVSSLREAIELAVTIPLRTVLESG